MINKDKIFEMLGVDAGESFRIKEENGKTYHFDVDFCLWYNIGQLGAELSEAYSLLDFLNGNCHIEKIKTITSSEKIVLEYAKLCGGKYIAKDENYNIYFYSHLPVKNRIDKVWEVEEGFYGKLSYCPFSLCSWEDFYPLCIEETLANYVVKDD